MILIDRGKRSTHNYYLGALEILNIRHIIIIIIIIISGHCTDLIMSIYVRVTIMFMVIIDIKTVQCLQR